MRNRASLRLCALAICGLFCASAQAQQQRKEARAIPLDCAGEGCPLLQGIPQTAGMRSGFVRLTPGQTVGRHTTGRNEEALIILRGRGDALLDGEKRISFIAPAVVYIPPATSHNVLNTGKESLEYVYVVAPASAQ